MAETLKFGAGQFATKEGSTLAYNDENGNFKPLPFTFDRSTSATRVNKEGLIEVVSNNEPRIDFLNDSKGALLLEPSRSNLVTYSEEFDNGAWSKTRSSIDANQIISPDGTLNADKIIENTDNNSHQLSRTTSVTAQDYISSVFIKKGERKKVRLRFDNTLTLRYAEFDLENGVVDLESNSIASIENYGNGWYRCSIKVTATATTFFTVIQLLSDNGDLSYQGDGTSGVYIWGAQLEQGSYATSYIPTQGSIGTRVDDAAPNKLDLTPLNIGNSYTLFLDVDLTNIDSNKIFSSINNSSNSLSFTLRNFLGGIRVFNNLDASYPINTTIVSSNNKFVIKVDGNSYKIFGKGSSLSGTLTTQRDLGFINFYGDNTELKIKNFTIDNTDLSDAECETLVN
jgi:hypothetical protein